MEIKRIFVSYTRADRALAQDTYDQIFTYLKTLQSAEDLEIWTDERIGIGDDWYREIRAALEACSAGILLVGPNLITNRFVTENELPALFERADNEGIPIFPVMAISTPDFASWMKRLHSYGRDRPLEEDQGPALRKRLTDLVQQIEAKMSAPPPSDHGADAVIDLTRLPGWGQHD